MDKIVKYIKETCIELEDARIEGALGLVTSDITKIAIEVGGDFRYESPSITIYRNSDEPVLILLISKVELIVFKNKLIDICKKNNIKHCSKSTQRFNFIFFKEHDGSELSYYYGSKVHYYIENGDEIEYKVGSFDNFNTVEHELFALVDGNSILVSRCAVNIEALIDSITRFNKYLSYNMNELTETIENTEEEILELREEINGLHKDIDELQKKRDINEKALTHYKSLG